MKGRLVRRCDTRSKMSNSATGGFARVSGRAADGGDTVGNGRVGNGKGEEDEARTRDRPEFGASPLDDKTTVTFRRGRTGTPRGHLPGTRGGFASGTATRPTGPVASARIATAARHRARSATRSVRFFVNHTGRLFSRASTKRDARQKRFKTSRALCVSARVGRASAPFQPRDGDVPAGRRR